MCIRDSSRSTQVAQVADAALNDLDEAVLKLLVARGDAGQLVLGAGAQHRLVVEGPAGGVADRHAGLPAENVHGGEVIGRVAEDVAAPHPTKLRLDPRVRLDDLSL